MTDKLTDAEIVKGLECCSKDEINGLNIFTYGSVPMRSLLRYALDLINRLQEDNERLCQIGGNLLSSGSKLFQETKAIKAEAYKECIEKVKMEAENATCVYEPDRPQADNMVYHISNIRLNNLLKELVGEDNAAK